MLSILRGAVSSSGVTNRAMYFEGCLLEDHFRPQAAVLRAAYLGDYRAIPGQIPIPAQGSHRVGTRNPRAVLRPLTAFCLLSLCEYPLALPFQGTSSHITVSDDDPEAESEPETEDTCALH